MCVECDKEAQARVEAIGIKTLERLMRAKSEEHRLTILADVALVQLVDRYLGSAEMTDEMVARANAISDRVWETELQGLGTVAEVFLVGERIVRSVLQDVDTYYKTQDVPAEEQNEHQRAQDSVVPVPAQSQAQSQGLGPVAAPMSGHKRGH